MKDLIPFEFESKKIRFYPRGDSFEVAARDVVEAIEVQWKGTDSIRHVPEEWRGVRLDRTPGGTQEIVTLSEEGFYFYLARSDKPKALPFQKRVTGEILPSIRKTGSYANTLPHRAAADVLEQELRVAALLGVPLHIGQTEAVKEVRLLTGIDYSRYLLQAPAQQDILAHEEMLEPADLAKRFGLQSGRAANRLLALWGWQVKQSGVWAPTGTGKPYCTKHHWIAANKSGYNLKWKAAAVSKQLGLAEEEIAESS